MVKEQEDEEEDDLGARTDGSSQKADGKNSEPTTTPRSKHSATEQRRRSKINERFQILRDLIPQSDQKRDKASFLLEVIEYVQFLQEKVQIYEGSYQGWNLDPTNLVSWKNHHGTMENFIDQSQVLTNGHGHGHGHDNNAIVNPAMLVNAPNFVDSDPCGASAYSKIDHHPPGQAVDTNIQVQPPNTFYPYGTTSESTTVPLQVSLSNAENVCPEGAVPSNSGQEGLTSEKETDDLSKAYSRGLLSTLTQALESSGVDLSQANISVQINVGKRGNSGLNETTSSSKNSGAVTHSGVESIYKNSDPAKKKLRTGTS